MVTTKQQAQQVLAVIAGLLAPIIGVTAQELCDGCVVRTAGGDTVFHLYSGEKVGRRYLPPWLHVRFSDPAGAARVLGWTDRLNRHSGKWNWNFSSADVDANSQLLMTLCEQLRQLTLPVDPAAYGEAAADADAQWFADHGR